MASETITAETATTSHPLAHGQVFFSPGCHFSYRVIGPCCRLFDREQLPWPCCRLQWRGKEPSWRRIGRRFIVDLATKNHPSYSVEILGQGNLEPIVITLYSVNLPSVVRNWWHSEKKGVEGYTLHPSLTANSSCVTCSTTDGSAADTIVEG